MVQQWSEGFPAERYFAYNEEAKVGSSSQESTEESSTDSLYSLSEAQGYQWERDFSGKREEALLFGTDNDSFCLFDKMCAGCTFL